MSETAALASSERSARTQVLEKLTAEPSGTDDEEAHAVLKEVDELGARLETRPDETALADEEPLDVLPPPRVCLHFASAARA